MSAQAWSIIVFVGILLIAVISGIFYYVSEHNQNQMFFKHIPESKIFDRTIRVTAEDGRVIFESSGKLAFKSNVNSRTIMIVDDNENMFTVCYGKNDTLLIQESKS